MRSEEIEAGVVQDRENGVSVRTTCERYGIGKATYYRILGRMDVFVNSGNRFRIRTLAKGRPDNMVIGGGDSSEPVILVHLDTSKIDGYKKGLARLIAETRRLTIRE